MVTLKRPEVPMGENDYDREYELIWYDSEKQMIVVILRQGGKRRIHIVQKHTGGCS